MHTEVKRPCGQTTVTATNTPPATFPARVRRHPARPPESARDHRALAPFPRPQHRTERGRRRRRLRRHRRRRRTTAARVRRHHRPRGRAGDRRHVAPQQLPGRGVRRAEPLLLLQLRPALGVDALLQPAARDPRLPAGHCGQARRAGSRRHRHLGHRLPVGRGDAPLDGVGGRPGRRDGELRGGRRRARDRPAQPTRLPAHPGPGQLRRARLPLGALGPRRRPDRQAGRGHRHRSQRGAVRARDRRAGRPSDGVPAHRQLVPAAPEQGLRRLARRRFPPRPARSGGLPCRAVRVPGVPDGDDPAPPNAGLGRTVVVDAVHADAAARPRGAAQGLAALHLRLQAGAVQLRLPAGPAARQRRAGHRADRRA